MRLTGLNGELRIYDSAAVLHGVAPREEATVDVVSWDGAAAYTNITANCITDDTSYANNFVADNDDAVFVGSDVMFAMIQFLKGGGADYAAGTGALKIYYFDGTDFSNEVEAFTDGSSDGTDCFAQDGYIGFKIPKDWALGAATAVSANLDDDKYYVKLMTTNSGTTDPDADILCPVDGQYFEIKFVNMDFTGPIHRPMTEEVLDSDRGQMDIYARYREGSDAPVMEPVMVSWTLALDDKHNHAAIKKAIACGNARTTVGADKITNGAFAANITGWDDNSTGDGAIAFDIDHMELDANLGTAEAGQTITGLAIGDILRLRFSVAENCTSLLVTGGSSAYGGTEHFTKTILSTGNDKDIVFTAVGTSLYLEFKSATDEVVSLDDISLYEIAAPRWNATGTTSKATTKNDGTNYNPAFADATKKTVNVQILHDSGVSGTNPIGSAYYEVYFPNEQQTIGEGEDQIPITLNGACYGLIEDIHGFGVRY